MKDRAVVCQYYIARGQCSKGRDAAFYGVCQHCAYYVPARHRVSARKDERRKKLAKIEKREIARGDFE